MLPTFRDSVDDVGMFMAGEAEADEPLLVEQSSRLLQQGHPPPVVLYQVIVRGEHIGDFLLDRSRRNSDWQIVYMVSVQGRIGVADIETFEVQSMQEVVNKTGMVPLEVFAP